MGDGGERDRREEEWRREGDVVRGRGEGEREGEGGREERKERREKTKDRRQVREGNYGKLYDV